MPRRPEGERALTGAEREARWRQRRANQEQCLRAALAQIATARTIAEAQTMAASALAPDGLTAATPAQPAGDQRPFDERVQAEVRRHIDEFLLPLYSEKLAQAEMVLRRGRPLTRDEYQTLLRVAHPDNSASETVRAQAFGLLRDKAMLLRPEEQERPLTGTLPKSVADLMAKKRTARR